MQHAVEGITKCMFACTCVKINHYSVGSLYSVH